MKLLSGAGAPDAQVRDNLSRIKRTPAPPDNVDLSTFSAQGYVRNPHIALPRFAQQSAPMWTGDTHVSGSMRDDAIGTPQEAA
jgi:hypothetical protein